jgi:glycosyltransferase involved in cell wall biosynthesis
VSAVLLPELPPAPPQRAGWPWTPEARASGQRPAEAPRITVITPSYEQGDFLEQTIRSVLLQGYPNLEYMVVDGGSSDNSVEIIERYAPWLSYWVSEPDRGQAHAINKGLERSTGEILCWLNSDDYFTPGTLDVVGAKLHRDRGAHAIAGHCLKVYADSGRTELLEGRFESRRRLLEFWRGHQMHQPSIFWRREVFDRVGALDEAQHHIMDFDYWARIAEHFTFENVDRVLACAHFHPAAKTGDNYTRYYEDLTAQARRYWGSPLRPEYWRLRSSFRKHLRAREAAERVAARLDRAIPAGETLILVDDCQSTIADGVRARCLPFVERGGEYWGRPVDDETAIAEVDRMRGEGAGFVVFVSPALWWLDHYTGLDRHLRANYELVFDEDDMVGFDLRSRA